MRLFITIGGGTLSLIEAVNYASPLLIISLDETKKSTFDRLITNGFGKHLDFFEFDESSLKEAVTEMMDNYDDYKKNIESFSVYSQKLVALENPLEKVVKIVNFTIETSKLDEKVRRISAESESCSCFAIVLTVFLAVSARFSISMIMNKLTSKSKSSVEKKSLDNSEKVKNKKKNK